MLEGYTGKRKFALYLAAIGLVFFLALIWVDFSTDFWTMLTSRLIAGGLVLIGSYYNWIEGKKQTEKESVIVEE
jgi:nicotinamide riboside transporter PnuC